MNPTLVRRLVGWLPILLLLGGCQTAYLGALEWLGYPKREVLVERIVAARDAQQEAREQFNVILDHYRAVVRPGDSDGARNSLEARYRLFDDQYRLSEASAREVNRRINAVEAVARVLFRDWEAELAATPDPQLQQDGRQQLDSTRSRYRQLIYTLHRAEARLEPVLGLFNDQVLFIKHNLNPEAVAALKDELAGIERQVAGLDREMENAIAAAGEFVQEQEASREKAREQLRHQPLAAR